MAPRESLHSTAKSLLRQGRGFARELESIDRSAARAVGLTPAEAHALIQLQERESVAMHDLAALLRIRRSTATRLADQLQTKGWVRRVSGTEDRRQVRLELLAAGRERALAFETLSTQVVSELLVRLQPRERGLDLSILQRLGETMQRWNDQDLD